MPGFSDLPQRLESQVHGSVSQDMFPGYEIDAITNGVHHTSWTCAPMQALFDKHVPDWRSDPSAFKEQCRSLPDEELWQAHMSAKQDLIDYVNEHTNLQFDLAAGYLANVTFV